MLNIIAGDGHTNGFKSKLFRFDRWEELTKDEDWQDSYFEGWRRFKKLRAKRGEDKRFNFDIIMANPPFAGDIKESRILHRYELGKKPNGKYQRKVGRDTSIYREKYRYVKIGWENGDCFTYNA